MCCGSYELHARFCECGILHPLPASTRRQLTPQAYLDRYKSIADPSRPAYGAGSRGLPGGALPRSARQGGIAYRSSSEEGRQKAALLINAGARIYLRSICQIALECVAAKSIDLHFEPPPTHVGSREDGWIARCITM